MTRRSEAEIDRLLAPIAGEYAEQDREAALAEADESDEAEAALEVARSAVFSVRLPPTVYEAVRQAAARAHLTPSALIRQWVSERVDDTDRSDLATVVAALRRDVERLSRLTPPD
jgi:hypothetical protein